LVGYGKKAFHKPPQALARKRCEKCLVCVVRTKRFCIFGHMNLINQNIEFINTLCKSHKVKSLYAFGSVLTDKFNDQSDIDLIVNFGDVQLLDYADNYFDLKFSLEDTLKRSVDLLEEKAIKNPYFKKAVEKNMQLIYG
jgi:predicted nucleotidyltransferase